MGRDSFWGRPSPDEWSPEETQPEIEAVTIDALPEELGPPFGPPKELPWVDHSESDFVSAEDGDPAWSEVTPGPYEPSSLSEQRWDDRVSPRRGPTDEEDAPLAVESLSFMEEHTFDGWIEAEQVSPEPETFVPESRPATTLDQLQEAVRRADGRRSGRFRRAAATSVENPRAEVDRVQITREEAADPAERPRAPKASGPGISESVALNYPLMLSLLAHPEEVLSGPPPPASSERPAVPGTFIPRPPPPPPQPEPTELDRMLSLMADGLLVGEDEEGGTEVRVTLKDEFFAGTELRIRLSKGQVKAVLVPPSRIIYWQLGGELHQLRDRLEARGLRVAELELSDPSSKTSARLI